MAKKITEVQMRVLKAMDPENPEYDPSHRPRGSLERLAKKGLVGGSRKEGWTLTDAGREVLLATRASTVRG